MAISINTNISSLRVDRSLSKRQSGVDKSFEKLSSGKDINRASDNPAGLAVASQLLAGADTSAVAARNISDGVSIAAIAEGAVGSASEITTRLAELATQASNGTLSDDQRGALNNEYQALRSELDRISQTTEFNGQKLLSGSSATALQVGTDASAASQISLTLPGVSSDSLGIAPDISNQANARQAIEQAKSAQATLAASRGEIGSTVSRLGTAYENLKSYEVNSREAASRIVDADVAKESSLLIANRIGQQAAVAVKAQANIGPSLALDLLR